MKCEMLSVGVSENPFLDFAARSKSRKKQARNGFFFFAQRPTTATSARVAADKKNAPAGTFARSGVALDAFPLI